MVTLSIYTAIIALTAFERLFEVRVSNRNGEESLKRGGQEFGREHYPFMVCLHTAFLIGCVAEVWLLDRSFSPVWGSFWLSVALVCQGLRWWVIRTLGFQWNTRVIVVPGLPRVTGGPFRYFSHPNYLAVVLEGIALPLIHNAYLTASIFTLLNALLLFVRIRVENRALAQLTRATNAV